MSSIPIEIRDTLHAARTQLMNAFRGDHWEGRLSSSALATAIAVQALILDDPEFHRDRIIDGQSWLLRTQHRDGSWGDSMRNHGNLTATLLAWCVLPQDDPNCGKAIARAESWMQKKMGDASPQAIVAAVLDKYGADRTFSVPILTMCTIAGRLGEGRRGWRHVMQLPFELAILPHAFFRIIKLPVVSYAIPALIAMGLARHRNRPSWFLPLRVLRNMVTKKVLAILHRMQPSSGGFLEAIPLTGFVCMALSAAGFGDLEAVRNGIQFLVDTQRSDGSWAIDSNLATWLTTLSVKAMEIPAEDVPELGREERTAIRDWLLAQQFDETHPFTQADPGAWGWTNLPGAVPDADDTAGALVALTRLGRIDDRTRQAGLRGCTWLMNLQNRDGGFPTFCRGWGKLPFDRSCPDITAHALMALAEWRIHLTDDVDQEIQYSIDRGLQFLKHNQAKDGSWAPLWFGSEGVRGQQNRTYGTGVVVAALRRLPPMRFGLAKELASKGARWLIAHQNDDGGWGARLGVRSSIEETAIALNALAWPGNERRSSCLRGTHWLSAHQSIGPAPIGLYFASLWYYERLYPAIFTAIAMGHLAELQMGKTDTIAWDKVNTPVRIGIVES